LYVAATQLEERESWVQTGADRPSKVTVPLQVFLTNESVCFVFVFIRTGTGFYLIQIWKHFLAHLHIRMQLEW
jgi:hypothetical protein